MASRKPARATSGQTRAAGSAPGSGSGSARRGGGQNAGQQKAGGQGTRSQNDRTRSSSQNRTQNERTRSGGQNGRGQGVRGPGQDSRAGQPGQAGRATATRARLAASTVESPAGKAAAALTPQPPLWFRITALVLSLGGLGMSIYLTIAHYTSTSILACSNKGYVNCAKVTTSPESIVFGVFPVAVLGLAFYVFMVAINSPWAWGSWTTRWPLIPWIRTAGIITGIGFVLYLIYAEVIQIGNICLLCTTVHIVTFLLFVLLMSVAPFFSKPQTAVR